MLLCFNFNIFLGQCPLEEKPHEQHGQKFCRVSFFLVSHDNMVTQNDSQPVLSKQKATLRLLWLSD